MFGGILEVMSRGVVLYWTVAAELRNNVLWDELIRLALSKPLRVSYSRVWWDLATQTMAFSKSG